MKKTITFINPIYCILFSTIILAQSAFAQQINLDNNGSKRILALVIGISDYKYLNDLQFAHKDAEDFAEFLTSKDGLNLPKSDVRVYINDEATQSKILYDGFQWLDDELNKGDEAFIFFSGHGDIYNRDEIDILKTGFLLTHESEEDKYETTALSMDDFLKQLHIRARFKSANIRVILDVCHAGIGFKAGGIIKILEMTGQYDPNKEIIITSCDTDESSYEYEDLQNGCFSYFFLEGLKGDADEDNDNNITLYEIKEYSENNVKRYVKSRNNSVQFPQFKGEDSHLIARIDGQYVAPVPAEHGSPGKGKSGVKKGIESNAEVTKILKKIELEGLSSQEIQSAYDLYLNQSEKTLEQQAAKRKMKRDLVAVMIDNADKTLTTYFDKEDEMINNPFYAPASEYYLKSAELLGKDHFLYEELLGKYFFMEALKLKALNPNDSKVINNLNSSLTLNSNASYTLNELGNVYFAKKEYKEALKYYEKANNISPIWGKNIIKTKTALKENPIAANPSSQPIPTPYGMEFKPKLASSSVANVSPNNSNPVFDNAKDIVFNIQLAAASIVNRGEFKKVEDLGPINPEFKPDKELIVTWLGPFDSRKEAEIKLKKARERGFNDAFLVETPRDSSFQKKLEEKKVELEKEQAASMPYQIRIAAVKIYNKSDYSALEKIGKVDAEPVTVKGKTLFRILMRFNSKEEAVSKLQKVKNEGFKDAYIFENTAQTVKSKTQREVPSSYEYTAVNPTKYKVRVATVSKLLENQFSNLENLGQIYMDVVHDKGLIRVSLGDYENKKKAMEVLDKIKKLGYKDAFIQF